MASDPDTGARDMPPSPAQVRQIRRDIEECYALAQITVAIPPSEDRKRLQDLEEKYGFRLSE